MPAPRVLITRSPHQASALADPTTFAPLDAALAHLDTFHWLLFTSANAVEAFHRRLTSTPTKPGAPGLASETWVVLPPNLRIAAIGSATARALEAAGLPPDLLPPQAVAESLAAALLSVAAQPDGTPTRFLLLRAETAREHLPDTLRAAGADVTIAPVYRNVVPSGSIAALRQLFSTRENWPAAITFTSSSTATNLLALLEASGLSLPQEIRRISIGPITSQTLRDLNLPPHAEAAEPTLPSLVTEVVKALGLPNLP
jgi:uroporphyrinogen-III synthase